MMLKSRLLQRVSDVFFMLMLIVITVLPRLFDLGQFLAADEKRWQANVAGFLRNLATGDWDHFMQQPHPGITQQWLGALTILSDSWDVRKLPLALGLSVLVGLTGYVFFRLWGKWPAVLLTLLLALNPVLVAHTRVYAMDALLAQFLLLSVSLLLLWQDTRAVRYLVAAGVAGAAAVLSKIPGVVILPFSFAILLWWGLYERPRVRMWRPIVMWLAAFLVALIVILPSLATDTIPVVREVLGFFKTDDYLEAHAGSAWYYVGTLAFSSTPLHLLALVSLPFAWHVGSSSRIRREQIAILLLCAFLFAVEMSVGAKKGDRYILPVFLFLDALLVISVTSLFRALRTHVTLKWLRDVLVGILALGVLWQGVILWQLHPYVLAYVNPLTKPLLGERRMGWGEGLDLAAEYLAAKPNAERLKVAAWYPTEFAYRFPGEVIPLNHFKGDNADYVVTYRGMFDRGPDAWETDMLNTFRQQQPEHIIQLNGIDYAWIYRIEREK